MATVTRYGGEDDSKGNGGKGGTAMARAGASAARTTSRARVGVMRRQQIVIYYNYYLRSFCSGAAD